MATSLQQSFRNAAEKIAQYVADAAEMKVDTRYVTVGGDEEPKLGASTTIKLDGDSESVVPLQAGEAGRLEVDAGLYEVHQQNVETAIEYRARILDSLLSTFTVIGGR